MSVDCGLCGDSAEETYPLALSWPAEEPADYPDEPVAFDDPGEALLALCGTCADRVATDLLVDRAASRGFADVYHGLDGGQPVADAVAVAAEGD